MPKLFIFLMVLPLFGSCSNSIATTNDSDSKEAFTVLYNSEYGGSGSDHFEVITNLPDWLRLWEELTFQDAESAPEFNPNSEMIIRKDFQSRNMGGNEYQISELKINGNQIDINYSIKSSKIGTDAITAPIILIRVKKTDHPQIRFEQLRQE